MGKKKKQTHTPLDKNIKRNKRITKCEKTDTQTTYEPKENERGEERIGKQDREERYN